MTIQEALRLNSGIEIESLLSHILGQSKEFLYLHPETKLTVKQANNLTKLAKRRQKGEPIAYILGYKYFYNLKFFVTPDVLVPRPETEWLVEWALKQIANNSSPPPLNLRGGAEGGGVIKILDVGTGSGNIIVSLAKNLKSRKVDFFGSDISQAALKIAKKNATSNKVRVRYIHSNLFDKIPGKLDLVIANLPYVSINDYKKLRSSLKFEPKLALTDGKNTWELYKKFFSQLPHNVNPGALVLLEIDPKSKTLFAAYLKKLLPSYKAKFYKDFNGLWRFVVISKP